MKLRKYGYAAVALFLCPFTDGNCMDVKLQSQESHTGERCKLLDMLTSKCIIELVKGGNFEEAATTSQELNNSGGTFYASDRRDLWLLLWNKKVSEQVKKLEYSSEYNILSKEVDAIYEGFPHLKQVVFLGNRCIIKIIHI